MKSMATQLALLLRSGQRKSNPRLLIKFFLVLIVFFVLYSVLFHVLMLYEGRQYSWITGFYWTLTTMSTLGFGDITFSSDAGRIFSVVVLLSGIIFLLVMLPFTFIQFFFAPWLEEQNKARAPRAVPDDLSGHVIFTHFDAVAAHLINRLRQYGIEHVIVISDLQGALELHDLGYQVVVGQLDHPETYRRRLRIDHAALVVVMNDDILSTNIIYTIRETNARVVTVTNADLDDSLDILQLAGSTHVFQFTKLLGEALSRRVLGVSMKANVIGRFDQLQIAEAPAMRTWLQGKRLGESRLRQITGVTVVGLWEQGRLQIPTPESVIGESSVLVLAGTETQLDRYDRSVRPAAKAGPANGPVMILGGGRVGQSVAAALKARRIDYRVVEKKTSQDPLFIKGSAGDLDTLIKAGIKDTPAIIITTHDDNLNIYLAIYCRRLRPDVQIISRSVMDRNINTLHRAGADLVMSYSSLVTTTIMNLLQPQQMLMISEGLNLFRVPLSAKLENQTLQSIRVRENTGCSVVAVRRKDELIVNPEPGIVLLGNDELVLIGSAESEKKFTTRYLA